MVTDPASAETIKYASNAFLATKLSFVNAVAAVCEAVGADVNDVVLGMGYDKRIGHEFLRPGPGWGGSLLPEGHAGDAADRRRTPGTTSACSRASSTVNEEQFERTAEKIVDDGRRLVDGVTIAVWGLTFKANTDDLPRVAGARDHRPPARARGARSRPTTRPCRGDLDRADGLEVVRRPLRRLRGRRRAGRAHRVGRVQVARPRQGRRRHGRRRRVVDARNLLDRSALLRRGFTYAAASGAR